MVRPPGSHTRGRVLSLAPPACGRNGTDLQTDWRRLRPSVFAGGHDVRFRGGNSASSRGLGFFRASAETGPPRTPPPPASPVTRAPPHEALSRIPRISPSIGPGGDPVDPLWPSGDDHPCKEGGAGQAVIFAITPRRKIACFRRNSFLLKIASIQVLYRTGRSMDGRERRTQSK